jgi:hypothetical protein
MLLFVCAVTAIILGFQHYLTMLGTTVLIPTLVFRSIGGHPVGPSSGARNNEREKESLLLERNSVLLERAFASSVCTLWVLVVGC